VGATELDATLDLSTKTVTLPAASVTAHVTATDLSPVRNDIATLALHSAIADNKAAYNLSNAFIDQFEDDTGIDVEADVDRASGEYMSSIIPADGNDSYTKYLVPSNTTNGSTVFTDTSVGGSTHTITAGGGVENLTAQKKFGTSSIYFDGVDSQLTIPDPNWAWRSASWTIDFWLMVASDTSGCIWNQSDTSGYPKFRTYLSGTDNITLNQFGTGGSTNEACTTTGSALTDDTWHHVAFTMDSGTGAEIFIDGVSRGTATFTNMGTMNGSLFRIGNEDYEGGSFFGPAWIDEFRVSMGIRRWTSTFTPPTSAYSAESVSATGNWTSTTETASSTVSKMGIVVLYKNNEGTATLDTDLIAQVSANGGTNYTSAPLTAAGTFSTGINIAVANDLTISNTGTAPKYKISFANQSEGTKETQVHGVALLY
ncbi:MAG: LamG domain-containing protein, partial [Anaerolineales bacterium]|nr:LamG domain-containing protein [Anaerolineales bacterium]